MFNVFRRAEGHKYTCYQEPIHEIALEAIANPSILLATTQLDPLLRHPPLDKPYFYELHSAHRFWKSHLHKPLIYDQYFDRTGSPDLKGYIGALIDAAAQRPVFQECRTANRIGAAKTLFGGFHIYLLRNPHDQWWSFLKDKYFSLALLAVMGADDCPAPLLDLREKIGVVPSHLSNIQSEFDFYDKYQFRFDIQYRIFFTIWLLGFYEALRHADDIVDMDLLSTNADYRAACLSGWHANAGIDGIYLDDYAMPVRGFDAGELDFFRDIEEDVIRSFPSGEVPAGSADRLDATLQRFHGSHPPSAEVHDLRQIMSHLVTTASTRIERRQSELGTRILDLDEALNAQRVNSVLLKRQASELESALEVMASERDALRDEIGRVSALLTQDEEADEPLPHLPKSGSTYDLLRERLDHFDTTHSAAQSRIVELERALEERIEERDVARDLNVTGALRIADLEKDFERVTALLSQSVAARELDARERARLVEDIDNLRSRLTEAEERHRLATVRASTAEAENRAISALLDATRRDNAIAQTALCGEIAETSHLLAEARSQGQAIRDRMVLIEGDHEAIVRALRRRHGRERARLEEMLRASGEALEATRTEAHRLSEQLDEALDFLSRMYATRLGKIGLWLKLLPNRPLSPQQLQSHQTDQQDASLDTDPIASLPAVPLFVANRETILHPIKEGAVNELRHVNQLLGLNGSVFIDTVYRVFLKRSADRSGRDHFIARLQAGDGKEAVLLAIAQSPEARAIGTDIGGLTALEDAQSQKPRRAFWPSPQPASLEKMIHRLEYTLGEAQNALVDRLDRIEINLEQIQTAIASGWHVEPAPAGRTADTEPQPSPTSIRHNFAIGPFNGPEEFIERLASQIRSSSEALSFQLR